MATISSSAFSTRWCADTATSAWFCSCSSWFWCSFVVLAVSCSVSFCSPEEYSYGDFSGRLLPECHEEQLMFIVDAKEYFVSRCQWHCGIKLGSCHEEQFLFIVDAKEYFVSSLSMALREF